MFEGELDLRVCFFSFNLWSLFFSTLGSSFGSSLSLGDLLQALGGVDGREFFLPLPFVSRSEFRDVVINRFSGSRPRDESLSTEELLLELREDCFGTGGFRDFAFAFFCATYCVGLNLVEDLGAEVGRLFLGLGESDRPRDEPLALETEETFFSS